MYPLSVVQRCSMLAPLEIKPRKRWVANDRHPASPPPPLHQKKRFNLFSSTVNITIFELGWGNDGGMIGIHGPRDPGTHRQFFSVQIAAPSPPDLRALEFPHHSCDVDLAVLQRPWPAKWAQQGSKMKQNASGLKPRAPKNLFGALKLKNLESED